jgi:hypothetical protein
MTPLQAIRKHCLDCSGGSYSEVKLCVINDCRLYPYRMGHNPARQGKGGRVKSKKKAIQGVGN